MASAMLRGPKRLGVTASRKAFAPSRRNGVDVIQRLTAINLLLDDINHKQNILRNGIIPSELIFTNDNYRPLMRGIVLPHKRYVNICGTDIVGDEHGALPGTWTGFPSDALGMTVEVEVTAENMAQDPSTQRSRRERGGGWTRTAGG